MSFVTFNKAKISGINYTTTDIPISEEHGRYFVSPEYITTIDLCEKSAFNLINSMEIDKSSIDFLILVSTKQEYLAPSSAHVLHARLDMPMDTAAFDISYGSAGGIYGLLVAFSMIESGSCNKILLVMGDNAHTSDIVNFNQHHKSAGACSILVEKSNLDTKSYFVTGIDSSKYDASIQVAGRYRVPVNEELLNLNLKDSKGRLISLESELCDNASFNSYVINVLPKAIEDLLSYCNFSLNDIDFFAFTQQDKCLIEDICSRLGITKYSTNFYSDYGYQGSASIFGNIIEAKQDILVNNSQKLCLSSFGSGLAYAAAILEIGQIYCSNINMCHFETSNTYDIIKHKWINKIETFMNESK